MNPNRGHSWFSFLSLEFPLSKRDKSEAQKMMAWLAIIVMILATIILFTPLIPDSRVNALSDLLGLFYFSLCGIVGTYMGATAFMHHTQANK